MKELGEYLKEARIKNGVSLEEAAEDNNLSTSQLENIENGNVRAFKDVYKLKEYIKVYSKYLGLDPNKVMDEFNDFLFEHTSKISIEDIIEAKKTLEEKEKEKRVKSPYTKEYKKKKNYRPIFYVLFGSLLICIIVYVIFILILKSEPTHKDVLEGSKEEFYEFTY